MTASSHLPAPNLMPLMRYRELAEAMGWLEQAFGFEKQIAVADSEGAVIYGQMTYRGGLMMMGAVRDTDLDKLMCQPDEVGGVETQSCYLVVEDADRHYQRALSAGADIVLELKSDGLGRRGYSCRDPEGHIWSFGTYNPGKSLTTATAAAPLSEPEAKAEQPPAASRRSPRSLMGIAALMIAAGGVGWILSGGAPSKLADGREAERAYAELVKVRAEKRQADERLAALQRDLDAEKQRASSLAAVKGDSGATDATSETAVSQEKAQREAAESEALKLKEQLKREQAERDAAVEAKRILEEKLAAASPAQAAPSDPAPTSPPAPQSRAAEPAPPATQVTAARDRIETSAMTRDDSARTEAPMKLGAEPKKADLDTKRERAQRSLKPRKPGVSSGRYPTYVTDLKRVWPYEHWSQ